ncbi:exodeoxyribonuclease VII small subunit [Virgibacillus sp. MSP4-1]|uniref:exodeoxyribonuclease VII small subunit n=1 Tax=Virgibacillus sp. MSP4-1 TaxID=2700081 RepID=UPI000399E40A|nr:exodeoxyribonuclease VII small subunit [Virgibacillus sp. MSP4-1]QHS22715.1 exodeoxyribonuclease VII small subunit [Virgibacillus sp. MSP4-1]
MSENEKQEISFEDAVEKLENIVEKLEEGDVPLEKAIEYYQEGMKLSKFCNDKLTKVEKQMEQILNDQGEFEPYSVQED